MDERIIKYFQGGLNREERLELLRNVERDELLKKQFVDYQNMEALLSTTAMANDRQEGELHYDHFIKNTKRKNFNRIFLKISAYAASIILLVSLTWFAADKVKEDSIAHLTNTLQVPAGQRACITLSDGTEVWLNAKSQLVYPANFDGNERRVTLIGEAYFNVAKDASKPFIVSSGEVEMKVLGTRFNVYGYPESNYICTSLDEGSLLVYSVNDKTNGVILKPNTEAKYENGEIKVSEITNVENFKWKEGIYSFEKERFENIIHKLELYYDVKIVVTDNTILNFEYTGKFRQRDGIESILNIIQKIHKFKIEKNEESNTIFLKK